MDPFGHCAADVLRDPRLFLGDSLRRAQPLPEEAHLNPECALPMQLGAAPVL